MYSVQKINTLQWKLKPCPAVSAFSFHVSVITVLPPPQGENVVINGSPVILLTIQRAFIKKKTYYWCSWAYARNKWFILQIYSMQRTAVHTLGCSAPQQCTSHSCVHVQHVVVQQWVWVARSSFQGVIRIVATGIPHSTSCLYCWTGSVRVNRYYMGTCKWSQTIWISSSPNTHAWLAIIPVIGITYNHIPLT